MNLKYLYMTVFACVFMVCSYLFVQGEKRFAYQRAVSDITTGKILVNDDVVSIYFKIEGVDTTTVIRFENPNFKKFMENLYE